MYAMYVIKKYILYFQDYNLDIRAIFITRKIRTDMNLYLHYVIFSEKGKTLKSSYDTKYD